MYTGKDEGVKVRDCLRDCSLLWGGNWKEGGSSWGPWWEDEETMGISRNTRDSDQILGKAFLLWQQSSSAAACPGRLCKLPSLDIFKSQLDKILSNSDLRANPALRRLEKRSEIHSNPYYRMFLMCVISLQSNLSTKWHTRCLESLLNCKRVAQNRVWSVVCTYFPFNNSFFRSLLHIYQRLQRMN